MTSFTVYIESRVPINLTPDAQRGYYQGALAGCKALAVYRDGRLVVGILRTPFCTIQDEIAKLWLGVTNQADAQAEQAGEAQQAEEE